MRAYSFLALRQLADLETTMIVKICPVQGCSGRFAFTSGVMDFHPWTWDEPPLRDRPEYPEVPEMFGYYPE